jgi:hypothetical protein
MEQDKQDGRFDHLFDQGRQYAPPEAATEGDASPAWVAAMEREARMIEEANADGYLNRLVHDLRIQEDIALEDPALSDTQKVARFQSIRWLVARIKSDIAGAEERRA